MVRWLIATKDGVTQELLYDGTAFQLVVNGLIVTPRFQNVAEVKDALKEFGYETTEFLQVAGSPNFPIKDSKPCTTCNRRDS
jgi:hypothetical protein